MFCYLYVFFDGTSIPVFEKEKCWDQCSYFKDNKCSIGVKRNEKLSPSSKYGWFLNDVIFFGDNFVSKSGNTKYLTAICLIHPASSDVWIVKCERLNKNSKNDCNFVYRIYRGHEGTEFEDLESLNHWIRKNFSYDGRKITEKDFQRNKGE